MFDRRRRLMVVVVGGLLQPVGDVRMGQSEILTQLPQRCERVGGSWTATSCVVTSICNAETPTTTADECVMRAVSTMINVLVGGEIGQVSTAAAVVLMVMMQRRLRGHVAQAEGREARRRVGAWRIGWRDVLGAGGVGQRCTAAGCEKRRRRRIFSGTRRRRLTVAVLAAVRIGHVQHSYNGIRT